MFEAVPIEDHGGNIVKFKPAFQTQMIEKVESEEWMKNLLSDDEWDIGVSRFEELAKLELLSSAESVNVKSFKIRWALKTDILNSIRSIHFPNLKQLFLNGNLIVTIEPLTMIQMPCIQKLNLKQNMVRSIDPLRKCNFPQLTEISIYFNLLQQADKLSELSSPLKRVWLNGNKEEVCQIQALSFMAKLESREMERLFVKCENRIEKHRLAMWGKLEEKCKREVEHEYRMRDDRGINWL